MSTAVRVALVITLYCVVSIALVFANKILMSSSRLSVPAPLFATWLQCVQTVVILACLGSARTVFRGSTLLANFPEPQFDCGVALRVGRLSVVFVLMIALNNMCLMYVEVSFYNVAKALSLLFNVLLGYLMLGTTISRAVAATILVVIAGFLVGSEGEPNFAFWGTVFGVLSSAMSPLNSIMTKRVLPDVGGDNWTLTLYNNINAVLLFIPFIVLSGELAILARYSHVLFSLEYQALMFTTGLLSFCIGAIVVLVIKYTSPLSFNIAGTFKNSLQTALAVHVFGNEITSNGMLGVGLVLVGSLGYAWVCTLETRAAEAQKTEPRKED